jgi:hypothetical protein
MSQQHNVAATKSICDIKTILRKQRRTGLCGSDCYDLADAYGLSKQRDAWVWGGSLALSGRSARSRALQGLGRHAMDAKGRTGLVANGSKSGSGSAMLS